MVIKTNFGTKQASEFNLGLVRFATPDEAILGIHTNKAVNPKGLNEAINSINGLIYDIVLLADNWEGATAPYTYTINSITGITSNTNAHTILNSNVTEAQLLSFREAMIIDGGLGTDTIVFKALGIKPSINIPIRLIVSKSLYIEDDYEPQYEVDTLPRATVDIYGTVRIATPFDVEDATSNIRVITPLLLAKNMPNGVAGLDANLLIDDSFISDNIARVNSPALTGIPTAPTASTGTNTTQIATTAFVSNAMENLGIGIDMNNLELTGNPTAPTQTVGDNSTKIATTAYVKNEVTRLITPAPIILDSNIDNLTLSDDYIARRIIFTNPNPCTVFLPSSGLVEGFHCLVRNSGGGSLTAQVVSPAVLENSFSIWSDPTKYGSIMLELTQPYFSYFLMGGLE